MKFKKSFLWLIVLALTYSFHALSMQEENIVKSLDEKNLTISEDPIKSLSKGQYTWGGVASIIPGFGLGHALQGRYMERGWIFTVSEPTIFIGFVVSSFIFLLTSQKVWTNIPQLKEPSSNKGMNTNEKVRGIEVHTIFGILSISLFVAFIGVKIWEAVDAWVLPSDYKVVDSSFKIQPLAYYDRGNTSLGLSLQYRF